MKRPLLLLIFIFFACSSDPEEQIPQDPIVGTWLVVETGVVLFDGEEFADRPCRDTKRIVFFNNGRLDSEIWPFDTNFCQLDETRSGEWIRTTTNNFPDSNYVLSFNETENDDEEIGFPEITFNGNRMRMEFEGTGSFDLIYSIYEKE